MLLLFWFLVVVSVRSESELESVCSESDLYFLHFACSRVRLRMDCDILFDSITLFLYNNECCVCVVLKWCRYMLLFGVECVRVLCYVSL